MVGEEWFAVRISARLLALSLLGGAAVAGQPGPALAMEPATAGSALEDFSYPQVETTPGITLSRGDGRIELVRCVDGGAGLLRVRSSVRDEEFCFDVKGPGGYLALELRKTYQLRGDGEHRVEAEVLVNGVPQDDPVSVPTGGWATLPVQAGQEGDTLVELRSLEEPATGSSGVPGGTYPFVTKVHVGDAATGGVGCTGALVDPWWVLTSRQCFAEGAAPVVVGAPKRATKVTLGRADVSGPGAGVVVSAAQLVPHPQRDVVLVKLVAAVDAVTPVKVAATAPAAGEVLRVVGFGRTGSAWVPDAAHTGQFTVTGVSGDQVQIGGMDANQVGPCQGDAGGPGLRQTGDRVELAAITATAGLGGCYGSTVGGERGAVQTRVDDLRAWIDEQTSAAEVANLIDDNSHKCLAVGGGSTEKGAHVIQWACSGAADQDWRLNPRSDGKYEVRNDHSGMCLGIAGGSKENSAHAVQWPCREATVDQKWLLERNAQGSTRLRNANSSQCLAIGSSEVDNGAHALQWPCSSNDDQWWTIKSRNRGLGVRNDYSGLCISTPALSGNGALAVQAACSDANNGEWQLHATVGGYTQLRNDRSGQCLAIGSGSTQDGAKALQWPCRDTNADQQWYVDVDAGGLTRLRNRNSDKCLAIAGKSKDAGAELLQSPCRNGDKDQQWRL